MLPKDFPPRAGKRPRTSRIGPHRQLDQDAPTDLQDRLRDYALSLPGVRGGPSEVAVAGSIAFFLDEPPNPPLVPSRLGCEWGHIHPHADGSLHLSVSPPEAERLIALGWAEYHPAVKWGLVAPVVVMVYGPRDEKELIVVKRIVDLAYATAGGATRRGDGRALVDESAGTRATGQRRDRVREDP